MLLPWESGIVKGMLLFKYDIWCTDGQGHLQWEKWPVRQESLAVEGQPLASGCVGYIVNKL